MPVGDEERAEYLAFAKAVAVQAGLATLPYFRTSSDVMCLENKAPEGFDPVTRADREAESVIRERIKQTYPNHGIYGCLLYTSPSPRDQRGSRMPSSA